MKKLKVVLSLVLVFAIALTVCACKTNAPVEEAAAPAEGAEENAEQKVYNIAYVTPSIDVPFWRYMAAGIENKAAEMGNVKVTVYDSKNSADMQYSNVQDVVTKKFDGMIISPCDSASCVAALDLCEEAGIPVGLSDIGTDGGKYVVFVKTNNFDGAKAGGEYLASFLKEGDKVAQINGPLARQNQQDRKAGFEAGIMTANVDLVDFRQMEQENRDEGESFTQDYLTAYPDLKAIFCTSDQAAMGCLAACQAAGRDDVLILGFDSNEDLVKEIEAGTIKGTCAQQPMLMVSTALENLIAYMEGQPYESEVEVETLLVTVDNFAETYDTLAKTAMIIDN